MYFCAFRNAKDKIQISKTLVDENKIFGIVDCSGCGNFVAWVCADWI
jgi:hypothetical protein